MKPPKKFSNFNPPFTNKNIDDFFNFETDHQDRAKYTRSWIAENFPDLEEGLAYHVPFYFLGKKKVFYLHYFWHEGELELEMSFPKGSEMSDDYELFQEKNQRTKSIIIPSKEPQFFNMLKKYVQQSMKLAGYET